MFGDGRDGSEPGNCFAACIASLLDLPIGEVPNFCAEDSWCYDVNAWLSQYDLSYIDLKVTTRDHWVLNFSGYHIISGPSPRSEKDRPISHCVIGLGKSIVHDPMPGGGGLSGDVADWLFGFLVRRFEIAL
jgi:hypothetical protein